MEAILSNAQHPEYGVVTIPFPIQNEEYNHALELLEALEIGDTIKRDCNVEEIQGGLPILKRLEKVAVNIDELDYLAKRLDSFDYIEAAQFQAMAVKTGVFDMKDLINLTFCCQQATVITDFSDLEAIGRHHLVSINGGCLSSKLADTDLRMTALKLILSKDGTVTPYGVVYDNGLKLEEVYDGRHLPGYVTDGTTTEIEWENTPITGQIQITKTSADYNSMNGWPAGAPIPNTVFEIYNYKTGKLMDTVRTDKNGIAVSKQLPLGRYKVVESKAADFYGLDKTPIEVEIEFAGQIVKAAMTNKSLYTNVSIKKTGYVEIMPGQSIRYDLSSIANNSTTALESFFWRDTLPMYTTLDKIVTGTWNVRGSYKVVYKTNLSGGEYRTLADNLSTQQNYVLDASPVALGLASNERVTEFMVVFGVVPANFRQVEAPRVYVTASKWLTGGSQIVNQADVGGVHNGQWIMATSRWVTRVYKPSKPLPRTGY